MLKDTFCSSPWFHIRINPNGFYEPCRWSTINKSQSEYHISDTSMADFMNSSVMCTLRQELLNGDKPELCQACHYEGSHNKLNGRKRQLLKSAITESNFEKSLCATPHWNNFIYSLENHGQTITQPVDLQIDLGNICNGACIMCIPKYSTKVYDDHKKLHKIEPILFKSPSKVTNWAEDDILVERLIQDIISLPALKYIHFLGGETLYIKSFYAICNRLIDCGVAKDITLGVTTNCSLYDERIEHIIKNFKQVHLGLSIETNTALNDYIRWPAKISTVMSNINKFLDLRKDTDLYVSLRITPNVFSIWHLDKLMEFMIEHQVVAESCNILYEPSCLRMELIPDNIRLIIADKVNTIINKYGLTRSGEILNRRRDDLTDSVIATSIFEYKDFIDSYAVPYNIEEERINLIKYIKAYELIHHNCILDYLPEYEEFLRSYNY